QDDALSALELGVEVMGNAENGVVDQDLEMLAEALSSRVPKRRVKLGKARRAPVKDLAQCLTGSYGLRQDHAPGAVAPGELGHPARDLDGHRRLQRVGRR